MSDREELKAPGVFALATPADMLAKLEWEVLQFQSTMRGQMEEDDAIRVAGYQAFNCAVTAWHLADWTWAYSDQAIKQVLAERFGLHLKNRDRDNRNLFFEAVATESRDLNVCRYIANSSKHLKLDKVVDRGFHAQIGYGKIPAGSDGAIKTVFGFIVNDNGNTILIDYIFGRAHQYWDTLYAILGYTDAERHAPSHVEDQAPTTI